MQCIYKKIKFLKKITCLRRNFKLFQCTTMKKFSYESIICLWLLLILVLLMFYKGSKSQQDFCKTNKLLNSSQITKEKQVQEEIKTQDYDYRKLMDSQNTPENENDFSVDERGFWKGVDATRKHIFDHSLAESILWYFKNVNASSILELGAGTGSYSKLLMQNGFFISCYDGNPNSQEISNGRCGVIDLSKKVNFCSHEWVLSLEVGEHIPQEFEDIFISNLHQLNRKGIILSWAILGQTGTSHVNNHSNNYIRSIFHGLGYFSDKETEMFLRHQASYNWFKNTIMVFKRNSSFLVSA